MDDIQKETRRAGTEAAEAARHMAEKGTARASEAMERAGAAARDAADTMSSSYATTLRTAQEYSGKVVEFTLANTNATLEFAHKLAGVTSPATMVEITTEHTRKQLETMTEQAKELAALARTMALASAEPFQAGIPRAFSRAA
jgi:phasin